MSKPRGVCADLVTSFASSGTAARMKACFRPSYSAPLPDVGAVFPGWVSYRVCAIIIRGSVAVDRRAVRFARQSVTYVVHHDVLAQVVDRLQNRTARAAAVFHLHSAGCGD